MSRDGNGVYTLPAGSTITNGDTSDASDLNTPLSDIESDLNVDRPIVAGGTGASTAKGARTNLLFAKGSDVASASALSLPADGNYFDVTGTTTVTSIDTWNVGDIAILQFDDAVTLTHHATNLILPTGADITTAAGDHAAFVEYASGTWRCIWYQRADGEPVEESPTFTDITLAGNLIHDGDTDNRITFTTDQQVFDTGGSERARINNNGLRLGASGATVSTVLDEDAMGSDSATALATQQSIKAYVDNNAGGGLVFISSTDASASANVSFTGFDASSYDYYEFVLGNVVPATDAVDFWMRTSTDGGSTYDSGAGAYEYAVNQVESNGTVQRTASTGDTKLIISGGEQVGSDTGEDGVSGVVRVYHPHLTKRTIITWELTYFNDVGLLSRVTGGGVRDSAADVDAVRFLFSSGNIESGSITMYGRVNA